MTAANHARGPFLATLGPVARLGGRDGAADGCNGLCGAQNGKSPARWCGGGETFC